MSCDSLRLQCQAVELGEPGGEKVLEDLMADLRLPLCNWEKPMGYCSIILNN